MPRPRSAPILAVVAGLNVALVVTALALEGATEEGVRVVVRQTAKGALLLFSSAFAASSLVAFWPGDATRWLLARRRAVGLSFALTHTLHLAALGALAIWFPDPFVGGLNAVTLVGGGLAYAFLFAMAATSNDAAVRALGAARWRALHTVGSWYIWLIFTQSYLGRAVQDPFYVPFATLLFGVAGLRAARRLRRPRAVATA